MTGQRSLRSPSGRRTVDYQSQTIGIGHRGARAFAPENTIPAFRKAAEMGCPMIELDVHLSRDDEVVVHHDDDMVRCTDVLEKFPRRSSAFVSDYTLDELRSLDAGRWYVSELTLPAGDRQSFLRSLTDAEIERFVSEEERHSYVSGSVTIPTLGEVLDLAQSADLMVNIEIKTIPRMYAGIAEKVVALTVERGMERNVLISSFDHEQLVKVREINDTIPIGVLTSDRLARPAEYLVLLRADAYHPGCTGTSDSLGFGSVSGELELNETDGVRDIGGMIFAWTCNRVGEMKTLIDVGVTGIMTDFPNRFSEAKARA